MSKESKITLSVVAIIVVALVIWAIAHHRASAPALQTTDTATSSTTSSSSTANSASPVSVSSTSETKVVGTPTLSALQSDLAGADNGIATETMPIATGSNADITAKDDSEIQARLAALSSLKTAAANDSALSTVTRAGINDQITANQNSLSTLRAQVDTDTDPTKIAADASAISENFRIYSLTLPIGYLDLAIDQANAVAGTLNGQKPGSAASAKISLAITDIKDAQKALFGIIADHGQPTVIASNNGMVSAARIRLGYAASDFSSAISLMK